MLAIGALVAVVVDQLMGRGSLFDVAVWTVDRREAFD
jgi:hypothetical protein